MINTIPLTFLTLLAPRSPFREVPRLHSSTTKATPTNDVQVVLLNPCHLLLDRRCPMWHPRLPFYSNRAQTELAQCSWIDLRLQVPGEQCGGERTLELYSRFRSFELQVHYQYREWNPSCLRLQQSEKRALFGIVAN